MKMKSTYEKPSERKKRVQTENLKRIKKKTSKIKKQILVRKMREKRNAFRKKLNGLIQKKVMDL